MNKYHADFAVSLEKCWGTQMRNWPGSHFSMDLTRCLQLF